MYSVIDCYFQVKRLKVKVTKFRSSMTGGHSQEQQRHRQAPIDDDD